MPETKQYITKVNIENEDYYFKDEDAREMIPEEETEANVRAMLTSWGLDGNVALQSAVAEVTDVDSSVITS